jgi:hypothetical protein
MAEHRNLGLEAMQQAALQMIAAARKMLDAAEMVITEPESIEEMATAFAGVARDMVEMMVGGMRPGGRPSAKPDDDTVEVIDIG